MLCCTVYVLFLFNCTARWWAMVPSILVVGNKDKGLMDCNPPGKIQLRA